MNESCITYSGRRFTAEGAAVWPSWRVRQRWAELARVTTYLRADGRGWQTNCVFRIGGELKLPGARVFSFGSGLGRYAEVLALACAHAPADAEIDQVTRDLAQWGTRDVRRRVKSVHHELSGVGQLIERARNQRAWLEHRRALKTIKTVLAGDARQAEAHRLHVTLLEETRARPAAVFVAADQWAGSCREDREARVIRGITGLRAEVRSVADEVAEWLRREPDQPGLTSALGDFYFRHDQRALARELWERFARTTSDEAARRIAESNLAYLQRFDADPGFRWRERAKRYYAMAAVWLPLALIVALYGWRAYMAWHPPAPPAPSPRQQQDQARLRRQLDETNRWLQENTGLVTGTDQDLRQRAKAGEAAAQYTLASRLLQQNQAPEQVAEGLRWLESAAERHYRFALLDLADRLDDGDGIKQDQLRAFALYDEAAGLGSARAAFEVGRHWQKGLGISQNSSEAFAWFEKAAAGGNREGMAWAGYLLELGQGVEKSLARAVGYYRQAAEKKSAWAAERLVDLLDDRKSPIANPEEARKWLWVGAEAGSPKLRTKAVGVMINDVTAPADKLPEVLRWLEHEVEQGNTDDAMARAYFPWSAINTPFDPHEAVKWFSRAGVKNNPQALLILGGCYAFGLGVERDYRTAQTLRDRLAALPGTEKEVKMLDATLRHAGPLPLPETPLPDDMSPRPVFREKPYYPMRWRRANVEGEALVDFVVDTKGFVCNAKAVRATQPDFGASAVIAVSCWRFQPGRKEGRAIDTHMQVPVIFTLQDEPTEAPPAHHESPDPS